MPSSVPASSLMLSDSSDILLFSFSEAQHIRCSVLLPSEVFSAQPHRKPLWLPCATQCSPDLLPRIACCILLSDRPHKLEFAVIYADDGISGTNTKKREDFNSFVYKLSEKEQQKKL